MVCVEEEVKPKKSRPYSQMSKIVKTSKHTLKDSNIGKQAMLEEFMSEYRRVASLIIDNIWDNGYDTAYDKNGIIIFSRFSVKENLLVVPAFIDYNQFKIPTTLTARAMSSLVTQLVGVLKASVEKQRKRLYILNALKDSGASKKTRQNLAAKIKTNIPQKPNVSKLNPELSSKCLVFSKTKSPTNKEFHGYIEASAMLVGIKKVYIPIRLHKHANRLISAGYEMLSSFSINGDMVSIRWFKDLPVQKETGSIVGVDQGIKTCVTVSDGQTEKPCLHGHTLDTITQKLARKRKGSISFKQAQDHRKNHINMVVNRLNLDDIKEIRLEEIKNIGYGTSRGRYLSHFTNTIIRDKIESVATQNGVRFVLQNSTYRSQRCSSCGQVRKANRKGKVYTCKHCGFTVDADLNAALNHEQNLIEIPYAVRMKNLNRGDGFFWKPEGLFDFSGRSLESLPPVEDI
jgi:transposase